MIICKLLWFQKTENPKNIFFEKNTNMLKEVNTSQGNIEVYVRETWYNNAVHSDNMEVIIKHKPWLQLHFKKYRQGSSMVNTIIVLSSHTSTVQTKWLINAWSFSKSLLALHCIGYSLHKESLTDLRTFTSPTSSTTCNKTIVEC